MSLSSSCSFSIEKSTEKQLLNFFDATLLFSNVPTHLSRPFEKEKDRKVQ
jgi:hypothetical protein